MMHRCLLLCIFALVMSDEKTRMAAYSALTEFLERKRLRKTSERFHILDKILSMPGQFEVEDICKVMADDAYRVSRATIYNTLSLFDECGLIRRCPSTDTRARYERAAYATSRFQLVCLQCGKIKDVKDAELARQISARRYSAFHPSEFSLMVYGICSKCMRQNKKRTINTTNTESTVRIKKQ